MARLIVALLALVLSACATGSNFSGDPTGIAHFGRMMTQF
jgi:hypothetical protein